MNLQETYQPMDDLKRGKYKENHVSLRQDGVYQFHPTPIHSEGNTVELECVSMGARIHRIVYHIPVNMLPLFDYGTMIESSFVSATP